MTEHEHPQVCFHSRRQTPRPPNTQHCAGFYTPGLRCSPSALCVPSDVPGTATEIDQNHMQYVAVRARGASKPFLSCIVSDLKRTLRASTGLQRNIYDINLAAQSTVRWILFSFPAASPEHGPVQKMETSRRLIWLFGGSRHLSVLGWWGEGTRQSSEKDRCTGRCPEWGASEAVSPSLSL